MGFENTANKKEKKASVFDYENVSGLKYPTPEAVEDYLSGEIDVLNEAIADGLVEKKTTARDELGLIEYTLIIREPDGQETHYQYLRAEPASGYLASLIKHVYPQDESGDVESVLLAKYMPEGWVKFK